MYVFRVEGGEEGGGGEEGARRVGGRRGRGGWGEKGARRVGESPIGKLKRYLPRNRVWYMSCSFLK